MELDWTKWATISSNVFVAELTRTGVLQISSLSLNDAGNYNCTAAFHTSEDGIYITLFFPEQLTISSATPLSLVLLFPLILHV